MIPHSPQLAAHGFTKVFSNAALHWIMARRRTPPIPGVAPGPTPLAKRSARLSLFDCLHHIIPVGGTVTFEMGGFGNVDAARSVLLETTARFADGILRARKRGGESIGTPGAQAVVDDPEVHDRYHGWNVAAEADPWFFPDEQWMRALLEDGEDLQDVADARRLPAFKRIPGVLEANRTPLAQWPGVALLEQQPQHLPNATVAAVSAPGPTAIGEPSATVPPLVATTPDAITSGTIISPTSISTTPDYVGPPGLSSHPGRKWRVEAMETSHRRTPTTADGLRAWVKLMGAPFLDAVCPLASAPENPADGFEAGATGKGMAKAVEAKLDVMAGRNPALRDIGVTGTAPVKRNVASEVDDTAGAWEAVKGQAAAGHGHGKGSRHTEGGNHVQATPSSRMTLDLGTRWGYGWSPEQWREEFLDEVCRVLSHVMADPSGTGYSFNYVRLRVKARKLP